MTTIQSRSGYNWSSSLANRARSLGSMLFQKSFGTLTYRRPAESFQ